MRVLRNNIQILHVLHVVVLQLQMSHVHVQNLYRYVVYSHEMKHSKRSKGNNPKSGAWAAKGDTCRYFTSTSTSISKPNRSDDTDPNDVAHKFNTFFNSNLQRFKRQVLHLQLKNVITARTCRPIRMSINKPSAAAGRCRTKFTFRAPKSPQSLWLDMFSLSSTPHHPYNSHIKHLQFNNKQLGLTFPTAAHCDDLSDNTSNNTSDEMNWFPPIKAQYDHHQSLVSKQKQGKTSSLLSEWRVMRYTKHIGYGKQCYDFVRNCVLNWEFHNHYDDNYDHLDHKCNNSSNHDAHNLSTQDTCKSIIPKHSTNGILKALPPSIHTRKHHHHQYQNHQITDLQLKQSQYLFPSSYYNNKRDTQTSFIGHQGHDYEMGANVSVTSPRTRMGIEENDNPNVLQVWTSTSTSSMTTEDTTTPSLSSFSSTKLSIAAIGRKLVTYTKCQLLPFLPAFYNMNPVCVIYDVIDQNIKSYSNVISNIHDHHHHHHVHQEKRNDNMNNIFTSTAYATLNGHLLIGEERVTVVLRQNGKVDVEILSCSKPSSATFSRLLFPIIKGMQNKFFINELEFIKHSFDHKNEKM